MDLYRSQTSKDGNFRVSSLRKIEFRYLKNEDEDLNQEVREKSIDKDQENRYRGC